jgi:hypothetical protein
MLAMVKTHMTLVVNMCVVSMGVVRVVALMLQVPMMLEVVALGVMSDVLETRALVMPPLVVMRPLVVVRMNAEPGW